MDPVEEAAKAEQAALAIIDQGIKDAAQENGVEPPKPEPGDAPGASADVSGVDGGKPAGEPGDGDPGKPGDGAAAGTDGGTKPDEGKPPEGDAAAAKPGEQPGAKPGEGKPPDDKDPDLTEATKPLAEAEGTKGTRERFHTLSELAKTRTQERDDARTQVETLFNALEDSGVKPEALPAFLEFSKGVQSRDPVLKRKAYEKAQSIVAKLAEELGEAKPGTDPLDGFDDLKKDVQEGSITKARAVELAAARRRQKVDETNRAQDEQQRTRQGAVDHGIAALNALGAELYNANKAEYTGKHKALKVAIRAIMRDVPPEKWVERARVAYKELEATAAAPGRASVGDPAPPGTADRNSMRPRQPAGGSEQAPNSHMDAIEAGIRAAQSR